MTSIRKLLANRANAKKSTGPKTIAGMVRAARNGLRHGLSLPVTDGEFDRDVEALARAIAGEGASRERFACARRIAAAQLDLRRVALARCDLVTEAGPDMVRAIMDRRLLVKLAPLERYEQRALARRRFAVRDFDRTVRNERRAKISLHFSRTKPTGENAVNSKVC